eukprot:SAG31_NODE_2625_length_5354_cov_2.820552_3_plen_92_part_00
MDTMSSGGSTGVLGDAPEGNAKNLYNGLASSLLVSGAQNPQPSQGSGAAPAIDPSAAAAVAMAAAAAAAATASNSADNGNNVGRFAQGMVC